MDGDALRWWVDHALLIYIVFVLTTKALLLRRETRLGAALAVNSATFALIYLGVFLATWFPHVFRSDAWVWFIRLAVAVSVSGVLVEFRRAYGSWRAMSAEVRHGMSLHGMILNGHRADSISNDSDDRRGG